jgi:hypothetical protein
MYFSSRHGRSPKSSDDWTDRYLDSEIERVMYGSSQEEIVAKLEEIYGQYKPLQDLEDEIAKQIEALEAESERLSAQSTPLFARAVEIVDNLPPDISIPAHLDPENWMD